MTKLVAHLMINVNRHTRIFRVLVGKFHGSAAPNIFQEASYTLITLGPFGMIQAEIEETFLHFAVLCGFATLSRGTILCIPIGLKVKKRMTQDRAEATDVNSVVADKLRDTRR